MISNTEISPFTAKIVSVTAVDFLAVTTTALFTVPVGKIFFILGVYGRHLVKSGTITSYTYQVERTSDSAGLLPSTTNVTTNVERLVSQLCASTSSIARTVMVAGDVIRYNTTASVFVAGAVCTGKVYLHGYLLDA